MALPPRTPAAATKSSQAKLSSSFAARDVMVAFACSTASGSTSWSGTSSATYTSSRSSVLSSDLVRLQLLCIDDEENPMRLERAKHPAKEFCHGNGDIAALERWLSEMGVGWVLVLTDDPSAGTSLLQVQPQPNNLNEITESIHRMSLDRRYLDLLEGDFLEEPYVPGCVHLFRIFTATVLKMLPFVDALLAATDLDVSNGAQATLENIKTLLDVRDALSNASEGIQLCSDRDSSAKMRAQRGKLLSLCLLSQTIYRLEQAIWNKMMEVRTGFLNDDSDDEEWDIQTWQGSPDICKVTRSLVTYIESLWGDFWRLNHIVRAAELSSYVPNRHMLSSFLLSAEHVETNPLTTLAFEMVSSLEAKLAKRSESFPDHSLKSLLLINNTHFIRQQLHPLSCTMKYHIALLAAKIEGYIQKYLQVSWAPVMSCLNNDTPHCFRKNSALAKFDLEFEKTYIAHKLWKVPDPELRTRLRKAIVKEVIPGLTGYLEVNNVTSQGVTPQEREEMLLELFEG